MSVVATGVGGITESDANLAVTSNAILLGFNVRADAAARRVIEEKGLDLRYYSIIYELIDDVKKALSGLLSPEITEEIIGLAEVRDVFRSSKFGAIAGCMVVEGVIKRNNPIRVLRNNVVVYEGALESLRRFKEDVVGGQGRYRVRHRREELQRRPGRRPYRGLRAHRACARAVTSRSDRPAPVGAAPRRDSPVAPRRDCAVGPGADRDEGIRPHRADRGRDAARAGPGAARRGPRPAPWHPHHPGGSGGAGSVPRQGLLHLLPGGRAGPRAGAPAERAPAGFLRHVLGQRVRLRIVPQLHFVHDESVGAASTCPP